MGRVKEVVWEGMKLILGKTKYAHQTAKLLVDSWYDSYKEARNWVNKRIKAKECILAVEKEDVAGVLLYYRDYSHYANYCGDLAVSKKHRKKGIATKLLKKYVEISKKEQPKKQRLVLSSTDVTNKASIKTHQRAGFKKIGVLKKLHYGKDEIFFGA